MNVKVRASSSYRHLNCDLNCKLAAMLCGADEARFGK